MRILLILLTMAIGACTSQSDDFGAETPAPVRQLELPPEERPLVLPNDIFVAVWNNNADEVRKFILESPRMMDDQNKDGNTPLGLAISLGHREIANILMFDTTPAQIQHQNKAGESYIILAARAGYHEIITEIGEKYVRSVGLPYYSSINEIDRETPTKRRAIHYAANRKVMEALEVQYKRDGYGIPQNVFFWNYLLPLDVDGRDFIHWAAIEGRPDVIDWASQRICAPDEWELHGNFAQWAWANGSQWLWQMIEAWTPEEQVVSAPAPALFNRQDKDGRTPLHLAALHQQWRAMDMLISCRWLHYELKDKDDNLAQHLVLKALNPDMPKQDPAAYKAFVHLMNQTTAMQSLVVNIPGRVNALNKEGETMMHSAARLLDPDFFNFLDLYGDENVRNPSGQSARDIFTARQNDMKATNGF